MNNSLGKYPLVVKCIVVATVIILLLPELLRFGLIKTVSSQGFGKAAIDDVDLNLFTGELSITNFALTRNEVQSLSVGNLEINVGWLQLFFGEIGFEHLAIERAQLTILQHDDGTWELVIPLSATPPQNTTAQTNNTHEGSLVLPKLSLKNVLMHDVRLTVDSSVAQGIFSIDQLVMANLSTWREASQSLTLSAKWNEAPLKLTISAEPLAFEPNLQGKLTLSQFSLASIAGATDASLTSGLAGSLNMDLSFNAQYKQHKAIDLSVNGNISLDKFALQYGPLNVNHRELSLQTQMQASVLDEQLIYNLNGDLQSSGLSIVDSGNTLSLLNWEQMSLSNFSFDHQHNAAIAQLRILAIDAANNSPVEQIREKHGSLYTGSVTLNNLLMTQGTHLAIDEVNIADAQYQVVVQKDGALQLSSQLQSMLSGLDDHKKLLQQQNEPEPSSSSTKSDALVLAVKTFTVAGESYIALQDLRFAVPVNEKMIIEKFTVHDIDQSQTDKPATVNLIGRIGEFSRAQISGELKPFGKEIGASLTGQLEALALPQLSPYSEAYLGYHLTTGQYDHQFDVTVNNGELVLQNQLILRELTLSSVDPNKPQPITRQLDIPLGFALDMLRDSKNTITLEVPIEGRLDDPNVNISSVVSDALGYALKNGATNYLKYAIQPYGAVIMAAQFVGDQAFAITLDSLVYASGQNELTQKQMAYIGKVSTLMLERPKLTVKLCGYANEKDKLAMQATLTTTDNKTQPSTHNTQAGAIVTEQELVELAKRRAVQVKRLLIDKGIKSKRVFLCQPQFQAEAINGVTMAM